MNAFRCALLVAASQTLIACEQVPTRTEPVVQLDTRGPDLSARPDRALEAIRQWRFVPAQKGGRSVQAAWNVTIRVGEE